MSRCVNSAKHILNAFYSLSQASQDITRLHPFVTVSMSHYCLLAQRLNLVQICWYLAAVVLVQQCKHFIETDEQDKEARIWGEINVLR